MLPLRKLVWVGLLGALAVGATLFASQGPGGAGSIPNALTVSVKRGDLEVVVLEVGRVEPQLQTQIKSKVGGQVIEVLVHEGESVAKDQVLLRIEPTDYGREVARSSAEFAQARASAAFAQVDLRRTRRARLHRIAAAAEYDKARYEAVMAQARLRAAGVALEAARDRLRYTAIQAPFAGTIIQRNVQPGEVITPGVTATVEGRPQLVLADLSTLLVKIELNQLDVARLRKGQQAEVTFDALPGKTFSATVTRVAPSSTTIEGRETFPVEVALSGTQDLSEAKPGMSAEVKLVVLRRPGVLLVPIEAVRTERGRSLVQVVERPAGGGQPQTHSRQVTVGARNDREVEIVSGLREGAEVVVSPPPIAEQNG